MENKITNWQQSRTLKANLVEEPRLINAEIRMDDGTDHSINGKHKYDSVGPEISVTPYLNCLGKTELQFWGWCIVLRDDGTWYWKDTSGG